MSTTAPATRFRLPRPSADTWGTLFGVAYLVMATNAMLALASLPLLVLLVSTDPHESWPALVIAAVLAAPGLAGAFGVFRAYSTTSSTEVIRTFATTWWRQLRRSLALGAMLGIGVVAIVVDLRAVVGTRFGAVVTPALVVVLVLLVSTALLALVASVERPDARLRDALKVGLYLGLRHWYLTALSLLVLALGAYLFTLHPALGVGLAAAPLLFAAWGNSRYSLRPVLLPAPPADS